jgi:hypothetical protein
VIQELERGVVGVKLRSVGEYRQAAGVPYDEMQRGLDYLQPALTKASSTSSGAVLASLS